MLRKKQIKLRLTSIWYHLLVVFVLQGSAFSLHFNQSLHSFEEICPQRRRNIQTIFSARNLVGWSGMGLKNLPFDWLWLIRRCIDRCHLVWQRNKRILLICCAQLFILSCDWLPWVELWSECSRQSVDFGSWRWLKGKGISSIRSLHLNRFLTGVWNSTKCWLAMSRLRISCHQKSKRLCKQFMLRLRRIAKMEGMRVINMKMLHPQVRIHCGVKRYIRFKGIHHHRIKRGRGQ